MQAAPLSVEHPPSPALLRELLDTSLAVFPDSENPYDSLPHWRQKLAAGYALVIRSQDTAAGVVSFCTAYYQPEGHLLHVWMAGTRPEAR